MVKRSIIKYQFEEFEELFTVCTIEELITKSKSNIHIVEVSTHTETRLICGKCGACAGHEEDRVDGECHFCHGNKIVIQKRADDGSWINA